MEKTRIVKTKYPKFCQEIEINRTIDQKPKSQIRP